MSRWSVAIALTLLVWAAGTVGSAGQEPADKPTLDAKEFGVSLARIKHKLDTLPQSEEARSLLRFNFYVEVYARAPQLDYFHGFDVHNSPITHGTPLHDEMLSVMRSGDPQLLPPAMNISNVLGWAWKRNR